MRKRILATAAEIASFKRSLDNDSCLSRILPGDFADFEFVTAPTKRVPNFSSVSIKGKYIISLFAERNIITMGKAVSRPSIWGKETEGM